MIEQVERKRKDLDSSEPGPSHTANGDDMTPKSEDGFERVLSREEKRKKKKLSKQSTPVFAFQLSGFHHGRKIGIAHIREFILHLLVDGRKPDWIVAQNKAAISHTVVLFIPGLLPEHLGLPPADVSSTQPFHTSPVYTDAEATAKLTPTRVPVLNRLFTYGCPTRAPGDSRRLFSVLGTLMSVPLPDEMRKKQEKEMQRKAAEKKENGASPREFLLTVDQMLDNDYPLPSYLRPKPPHQVTDGHDSTQSNSEDMVHPNQEHGATSSGSPTKNGVSLLMTNGKAHCQEEGWREVSQDPDLPNETSPRVLAIDCEMVLTTVGQELARVSVIDFNSDINIFDEYVQVENEVIDYRTQWSGVTPEKLKTATHTLASIQAALLDGELPLFTPQTILLGHSLECDLTALKIRHPHCIDTALMYSHPRGPPYKPGLRWLTQKWLDREIQASEKGHDSEEDARACVDLLKLKMKNGPDFGAFLDTSEPIFERLARYTPKSITSAYCDCGHSSRPGHGAKATNDVKCENDEGVISAMIANAPIYDFTFGRLMELSAAQGWNREVKSAETSTEVENGHSAPRQETLDSALANLNDQIERLHSSLPTNTAFIILTGHSNPIPMLELAEKRQKWERLVKLVGGVEHIPKEERWMSEDDRALEARAMEAREGMALFLCKS